MNGEFLKTVCHQNKTPGYELAPGVDLMLKFKIDWLETKAIFPEASCDLLELVVGKYANFCSSFMSRKDKVLLNKHCANWLRLAFFVKGGDLSKKI